MTRASLLERLGEEPFDPIDVRAENDSFGRRALAISAKLYCHAGFPVAHIDVNSGLAFLPHTEPLQIHGNQLVRANAERLASFVPAEVNRAESRIRRCDGQHEQGVGPEYGWRENVGYRCASGACGAGSRLCGSLTMNLSDPQSRRG